MRWSPTGNAAYQNALMWCITGDEAYATKSVQILNAWGKNAQENGWERCAACRGIERVQFVNAAEAECDTRTRNGPPEDVRQFEAMLRQAVLPPII